MIKKIIVFGDSYMYGTELPQDDSDIKPRIEKIVEGMPRDPISGAIPIRMLNSVHFDALWDIELSTPDYEYRCHRYSIGGILTQHYGIETYKNYAWAGYSNTAIMSEIIEHLGEIGPDTLVIVGLTYPSRTTRLNEPTDYGKTKSFNNFSSLAKNKDHRKFIELAFEYDDDMLTKYLNVINFISFIDNVLSGVPHIIIDPINIFRENNELNGKILNGWNFDNKIENTIIDHGDEIRKPELVKYAQQFFNSNLFPYTFNHSILHAKTSNYYGRSYLGHPSRKAHQHFANEYLIPHINTMFG